MALPQTEQNVADLHWLAALLTGSHEVAADVTLQAIAPADGADPFFVTWMHAWARRLVIAKALMAVRGELAESARRTALRRTESSPLPPRTWSLGRETSKSDLERALLAIDLFPRAAVLLLAYEHVPLQDAATLLDAEPDLVRTALAAGLRDLTINLARAHGWREALPVGTARREEYYVRPAEVWS